MKKRIEFSKIKTFQSKIQGDNSGDENPENQGSSTVTIPEINPEFRLKGETLTGYGPQNAAVVTDENGSVHSDMGGWPEMEMGFTVAESDLPRVYAWFNDRYEGVTEPESATLVKNRRTSLHNALNSYHSAARAAGLFTSPFRIGCCFKLSDGSLTSLKDLGILYTFMTSPVLPIVGNSISDKYLLTRVQLRNIPGRLQLRIPDITAIQAASETIVSVEIFATDQVSTFNTEGSVSGVRTSTIDNMPTRCWQYEKYSRNGVEASVEQSAPFRRIVSIPIDNISDYSDFTDITLAAGILTSFSKLPNYDSLKSGSNVGDSGDDNFDNTGMIRILTEYLHLDYPEDEKSIRSITLRGVFNRNNIRFRLYGSQHREKRILFATARGAYMRGICRTRIRWVQVEIECDIREGDFLEAITFDFSV